MLETESPYRSPAAISSERIDQQSGLPAMMIGLVFGALPVVGGMVGFNGYIVVGKLLETMFKPGLSHGQQAGFVSLPICTLVCGTIGLGLAFMLVRRYLIAACMLFAVAFCSSAIVGALWQSQVSSRGSDPSEYVLYYPPLVCSAVALLLAVIAAIQRLLPNGVYGTSSGNRVSGID